MDKELLSAKNVYFINEKCIGQILDADPVKLTDNNVELLKMFLQANEHLAEGLDKLWPEWRTENEC